MDILLAEKAKIEGKNAGNKARKDVETILVSMGVKHINLYNYGDNICNIIVSTMIAMIKTLFYIRKGDMLIIEHPYTPNLFSAVLSYYAWFLRKILHIKTVVIVHDIKAIRHEEAYLSKEISILERYNYIIVHNEVMQKMFLDAKCRTETICLGLFDYLIDEKESMNGSGVGNIIIAGNLRKDKSGYIYKIPDDFEREISLYGMGVNIEELPKCMKYKGAFSPENLPNLLEGDYGLVWDGDDINGCTGWAGEYLKYNNPHKASLYIVAGKPLIVWKKSAIASYVCEKKLGIVIDCLDELPEQLKSITKEVYLEFVHNVLRERDLLMNGVHLKQIYMRIKTLM